MILIVGLRSIDVGYDTLMYYNCFIHKSYTISKNYEWTWIKLCYICDYFNFDFHFITCIYSILTIIPYFVLLKKYCTNPYYALLLFIIFGYYFWCFNIIRQAAAVSFGLFSIINYYNKKYFKFILWLILSISLHLSALCIPFLLICIHYLNKLSEKNKVLILIISLFGGLFLYFIINYLSQFIFIEKFSDYNNYAESRNPIFKNIFIINAINCIWASIYLFGTQKKYKRIDKSIFYTSIILNNIISYNIGINRIVFYILPFQVIYYTNILRLNKNKKLLNFLFLLINFIFLFRYIFISNSDGVFIFK